MKVFVAMTMVLVLALVPVTMGLLAQAEGLCHEIRAWEIGTDEGGKVAYYVTYAAEDGTLNKFRVSQSVFETAVSVLHERKLEEERIERIKEYQSNRGSWVKDAMAWCSFWNPND